MIEVQDHIDTLLKREQLVVSRMPHVYIFSL